MVGPVLAGLLGGLVAAQPPAEKDKKVPPVKEGDKKTPPAKEADKKDAVPLPDTSGVAAPEAKSITTADGVTVNALFYKSAKGVDAPTVILLHDYKQDPNAALWDGTAKILAAGGFNTLRFAFRGHGEIRSLGSKDIDPADFFGGPFGGINRGMVSGGDNPAKKKSLDWRDFRPGYQPMLVQDLAAVRCLLDQMNDTSACNTSSVYLIGAGSSVNLGFLFLAAEWRREREKPTNILGAVPPVSAIRGLVGDVGPAGQDYAGCVWLGPTADAAVYPTATVQSWVSQTTQLKLRDVPMLFLYGAADAKGKQGTSTFYESVLKGTVKKSAAGPVRDPQFTYKEEVGKGARNAGAGLLGINLGTEQSILKYLTYIESERKNKIRKDRRFDKPLPIDVRSFGVLQ